jgi:hypothetical protein
MPIDANTSAIAPKIVSSNILKLCCAMDSESTSCIVRMCETGRSGSTVRNSFWICATSGEGLPDARTSHAVGSTELLRRVNGSGI